MFWEILGTILCICAAIIFAYCGYVWVLDTFDDLEYNKTLSAILVALIAAFVGYFFWFAIGVIYFGVKLLAMLYIMFIQIVEMCYKKLRRWIRRHAKIQNHNIMRINKI